MGLDMYLEGEFWVEYTQKKASFEERKAFAQGLLDSLKSKMPAAIPDGVQLKIIRVQLGYWRKANQIHNWFVENCQGGVDECQQVSVSLDQIKALRELCLTVLAAKSQAVSSDVLPTQSGFFFGGTDYDDYYYEDLERTVEICDRTIEFMEQHGFWCSVTYQSSW